MFIEPGSPWQNPYVESFNARVRDELLNMNEFYSLAEAEVLVADFQMDCNCHRPHSSLGDMAPAVVRRELVDGPSTRSTLIASGPGNGVSQLDGAS